MIPVVYFVNIKTWSPELGAVVNVIVLPLVVYPVDAVTLSKWLLTFAGNDVLFWVTNATGFSITEFLSVNVVVEPSPFNLLDNSANTSSWFLVLSTLYNEVSDKSK